MSDNRTRRVTHGCTDVAAGRIARPARVDASNIPEISHVTLLKFEVDSDPDLRVGPVIVGLRKEGIPPTYLVSWA